MVYTPVLPTRGMSSWYFECFPSVVLNSRACVVAGATWTRCRRLGVRQLSPQFVLMSLPSGKRPFASSPLPSGSTSCRSIHIRPVAVARVGDWPTYHWASSGGSLTSAVTTTSVHRPDTSAHWNPSAPLAPGISNHTVTIFVSKLVDVLLKKFTRRALNSSLS